MTNQREQDLHPSLRTQIFKPVNLLKQKVGDGGIDDDKIKNAQRLIDECSYDGFLPLARELTGIIYDLLVLLRKQGIQDSEKTIKDFAANFVQLKANGAMFRYPLVTRISDNVLHFLDSIPMMGDKELDVVQAHYDGLHVVIEGRLEGLENPQANEIHAELTRVCQRYFKDLTKHAIPKSPPPQTKGDA